MNGRMAMGSNRTLPTFASMFALVSSLESVAPKKMPRSKRVALVASGIVVSRRPPKMIA